MADAFASDVFFLHQFDGTLVPAVGEPVIATGTSFVAAQPWVAGQVLEVGGSSNSSAGGPNSVRSAVASTLYDCNWGDVTLEALVRFNSAPSGAYSKVFMLLANTGDSSEYVIIYDAQAAGGLGSLSFFVPSGASTLERGQGAVVTPGEWYHLVLQRAGNVYSGFVNGLLVWTYTTAYRRPAGPKQLWMGNHTGGTHAFDGQIAGERGTRAARWPGATSFDPLTARFEAPVVTPPEPPAPPVSFWPGRNNAHPAGAGEPAG